MKKIGGKGLSITVKQRLDRLKEIGFNFHLEKNNGLKRKRRTNHCNDVKRENDVIPVSERPENEGRKIAAIV
jgi:hypothetical protein